jgi:hypothetical protein
MLYPNLQARYSAIWRIPSLTLKRSAHFLSILELQIALKALYIRAQVHRCVSKLRQIASAQHSNLNQSVQTAQTLILSAGVER